MQVINNEQRLGGQYEIISPIIEVITIKNGFKKKYTKYFDLNTGAIVWLYEPVISQDLSSNVLDINTNQIEHLQYTLRQQDDIPELGVANVQVVDEPTYVQEAPMVRSLPTRPPGFIIPNPHVDKELLTEEQLREVVAWVFENSVNATFPKLDIPITGIPNSAATKLIDFLGTIVYGPNNYIGPSKTGLAIGDLDKIVTTVPALSEADGRARAHDIALTVAQTREQADRSDSILPPLAQAAQVFRNAFVPPPPPANTEYSSTSRNALAKTGTIELNPGPIYNLNEKPTSDHLVETINDPAKATTYLSDIGTDPRVMDYACFTRNRIISMRTGAEDLTSQHVVDVDLMDFSALMYDNDNGSRTTNSIDRDFVNYTIVNKVAKSTLSDDKLGTAIASSLTGTDTFTNWLRTQVNLMNGQAAQVIYQRAPKIDYGCYLPCAKLLAYESMKVPASGGYTDLIIRDSVTRSSVNVTAPEALFPNSGSVNMAGLPPGYAISAYYATPLQISRLMLGQAAFPANWGFDRGDIAWVIVPPGMSVEAIWYYTICHFQYPFFKPNDNDTRCTQLNIVAGGIPTDSPVHIGARFVTAGNIIQGPVNKVVFLPMTNDPWSFGGLALPVLDAANVSLNIVNQLIAWLNGTWGINGETAGFEETLQVMLGTMDLSDWRAANILCSALRTQSCSSRPWNINNTAANSSIIIDNRRPAPSVNAQVTQVTLQALTQVQLDALVVGLAGWLPTWNCLGVLVNKSSIAVNTPAIGGAAVVRDTIPVSVEVQDSGFLTKYAIHYGMFQKETVGKGDINKLTSFRMVQIMYMQREIQLTMFQCLHNFFQSLGASNAMVVAPFAQTVIDRRSQIYTKLYSELRILLTGICGYAPFRPQLPSIPNIAAVPGALGNYINLGAILDSPLYLFDHMANQNDEKHFYDLKDIPNQSVLTAYQNDLRFGVGATTPQAIFGVNIGGANATRVIWHADSEKRWTKNMKRYYAMSKIVHLNNVNPVTQAINVFTVDSMGALIIYQRPILKASPAGFLRWTSNSTDSGAYRQGRFYTFWTLPAYPAEMNIYTGAAVTIASTNQTILTQLMQFYSIKNFGSSNFGLIQQSISLDSELAVDNSPF